MNSKFLFADLKSGMVVFLVALPLCLGISMACGVPLFSGIIAGFIGGTIITLFSGAKYSVSGPAAGLTAIVISSIAQLGSYPYFLAAVVIAGALQIILSMIKAGGIANYIPNAVIKGMLAGIGLILILKQLPHLVGYDADPEGDMYFIQSDGHNSVSDLYYMLNFISPGALIIGLVSVILILISERKFYKKDKILSFIPGPLLVVIVGILLNISFSPYPFLRVAAEHMVSLPSIASWTDLQNNLSFPDFSLMANQNFWIIVITLALVASLETLLGIEAIEKLDPDKKPINTNKELLAQGLGNIFTGLLGGLPLTSVIVRSSANMNAGAKTKFSIIVHALLLLGSVIFFPKILGFIPNSVLAVILIMTGYKLAKVSLFKQHLKMGWDQFLPFIITIVMMLLTDLLKGVTAGIICSLCFIIRNNVRSSFDIIEEYIDGRMNYLIKLPQHITFFNKGFMINYLNKLEHNCRVIIDGSINKSTDKDVKDVLSDFIETSKNKNIEIQLVKYTL